MGSARDDEDSHRGRGSTPKLTLAGQIDAMVDGRPLSLIAERQELVLSVRHWRTLLMIRRSSRSFIHALRQFLSRSDFRLFVRIKWLVRVQVHPHPSFFVRMLLPRE